MTSTERTDSKTTAISAAGTAASRAEDEAAEQRRENEALKRELAEAREEQAATGEILRVISRSSIDLQTVLNAMAESAARVCKAQDAIVMQINGRAADDAQNLTSGCLLLPSLREFPL